jgi:hypothetical protein
MILPVQAHLPVLHRDLLLRLVTLPVVQTR